MIQQRSENGVIAQKKSLQTVYLMIKCNLKRHFVNPEIQLMCKEIF